MKQSKLASLIESVVNVFIGFGVAVCAQLAVFPMFGVYASLSQGLGIGAAMTLVSVARSFLLRRLFEAIRVKGESSKCL